MSANCPPQLHLTLPANATSFKRSFEQFGFDLESPTTGNDVGSSSMDNGGRRDRNKRARSASSVSAHSISSSSSRSSTVVSSGEASPSGSDGAPAQESVTIPPLPPRLPTPVIQDIEMPDYPLTVEPSTSMSAEDSRPNRNGPGSRGEDGDPFSLTLQRFGEFDTQISVLRHSRTPSLPRTPTPPPTLPPLSLAEEQQPVSIPFLLPYDPSDLPEPPRPNPPGPSSPRSNRAASNQSPVDDDERPPNPTSDPTSRLSLPSTEWIRFSDGFDLTSSQLSSLDLTSVFRDIDETNASEDASGSRGDHSMEEDRPALRPLLDRAAFRRAMNTRSSLSQSRRQSESAYSYLDRALERWFEDQPSPWDEDALLSAAARDRRSSEDRPYLELPPLADPLENNSRYIEQGLLDPRETESDRERGRRRDTQTGLTAWLDIDERISESEQIHRMPRRPSHSPVGPRLATAHSEESLRSLAGYRPSARSHSPSPVLPTLRRLRTRAYGSYSRPGSSNSLISESASEIRRRNAHAELMERLQSDVPRPEREPDSDDEWQDLALPPGRGRFSSSRHADAWSELFDRPESHSSGQEDLTFRYPVRVLPNYSSSDRARGSSTADALRERRLAYLLRRGSEPSSYHNISASRTSPSHSPVRRSSSLNDHPSRPPTDESQRNGRAVPRPPERHLSVDFFDSRSSTISDMARAVTRNGRQENSPFYSDPLLSRQPSAIPPSIPPPDLGAIFIPHTSDPAEPEPYGLPPLPPVDPTVSELLNYERGASPERRPPAPTPSRQSAATLRPDTISIDPNAFAPGPFRNTMIWQADRIRARQQSEASHPPSIPPLPFEDDLPPSRSRTEERSHPMDRFPQNPPEHLNAIGDRLPPRRTNMAYGRTASDSTAPRPVYSRRVVEEEPPRRLSSDIHSYLSRRARMEASRLEQAAAASAASRPDMDGFSHALEMLRHDGLSSARSRQFIDQYHEEERQRERERAHTEQQQQQQQPQQRREERRTATSTVFRGWGDLDDSSRNASHPPSYSVRRRSSPSRPAGTRPSAEPLPSRAAAARGSRNNSRYIRAHHHEGYSSVFRPLDLYNLEFIHAPWRVRRARPGGFGMGDFVRDEDFDDSYEGLLSLSSILGDVPKATPADVISGMKTGLFKDWSTSDSDHRCPICLDDYSPTDPVMKLNDCSHWLHKECLEQWLKGARTCPVCRKAVKGPSPPQNRRCPRHSHQPTENPSGPRRRDGNDDEGNDDPANPGPRPDGNNSSGAGIGLGEVEDVYLSQSFEIMEAIVYVSNDNM